MSELKVDKLSPRTGNAFTLGDSGDTFTVPSGATIVNSGTATGFGGGKVVQVVNAVTTARVTGTTVATQDDTIPQNSEGVEMLTLAITPTNASNKLVIIVNMSASHTIIQANIVMALFQDSTANAIAAIMHNSQKLTVAQRPVILHMDHFMTAGTTSATTFKVRIGSLSTGTIDINSAAGARLWGGVSSSTIRIMEISA